jgi:hypothetical protein
MSELQSAQTVWGLINSHTIARCIHVVADAGVADALAEQPASATELAARCGLDADALHRMLRLLSAYGVFARDGDRYVHTPESRLLRSDHPHSLRAFARMIGMPVIWDGFTRLDVPARTGRPALDWAGLVHYFSGHPQEASLFNEAMVGKSGTVVPAVIESYDFARFNTIADIGGGRGHLLQAILERVPSASGILFELPHVVADAADIASSRLQLVRGDFFTDALPIADAYILMEVIHDWPDSEAQSILRAVRRAAPQHARLLIVETTVADTAGPHFGKMLDIVMLAVTGGRERTISEYESLLGSSGFRFERVVPTTSQYSIIEAVPT